MKYNKAMRRLIEFSLVYTGLTISAILSPLFTEYWQVMIVYAVSTVILVLLFEKVTGIPVSYD